MASTVHPTPVETLLPAIKKIANGSVTRENILSLVTAAMVEVERIEGLAGPEKKQVVIAAVTRVCAELVPDETARLALTLLLPGIIDALVAAAKGKYRITKRPASCNCL